MLKIEIESQAHESIRVKKIVSITQIAYMFSSCSSRHFLAS